MELTVRRGLIAVILLVCTKTLVKGSPEIAVYDKVATLYEGVTTNEILSTIQCSDSDGDITNTYVQSTSPSSPCANCFEILDCLPNECLQYRAGVGTLNYGSASSYLVTIACADGNEVPATEIVQILIVPNSPPYFDQLFVDTSVDAAATGAGGLIYDVDATDDEGDDLTYSMTVLPSTSSGNYQIDSLTGEITATVDMRADCITDLTFSVYADDGTTKSGPMVINVALDNANTAPIAVNLGTTVQIPEDSTGTAYTMIFVDGDGDTVTYTHTATNTAGLAQFTIDGTSPNIDIATTLDYEQSTLRVTDLFITATDGYCTSSVYSLRLQVTDVNEEPSIQPEDSTVEVCEYEGEFDPGYVISDPDAIDTHTWSFHSSMMDILGRYGINRDTGDLKTIDNYNVDSPDPFFKTKKYNVQVTDKGGLTATATVTVSFLDCNDNAPVFVLEAYSYWCSECAGAGTILGLIQATDLDSSYEQNNVITFSGSGGAVSVGSGGDVVVNSPLPAGNVITFNAYATDQGQTPGPLTSENPAVISVIFTPCPTTQPPTTAAATAAATTTTTTTTTAASYTREPDDPNLPWIIIAALLGTFLIGLMSFMLWRYGALIRRACENVNCSKCCKDRHRPPRHKEPKESRRKPYKEKPSSRPVSAEPEEKEPVGPGFLFGFWKERYPDDDHKNKIPDRKTVPTPGDMETHYQHTIDPVEPPTDAHAAADPPKKKKCAIM